MSPSAQNVSANEVIAQRTAAAAAPRWSLSLRIAFRFFIVYLGLYVLLTQMFTSLVLATTNDSGAFEVDMTAPAKAVVIWLAAHVFRIGHPIVTFETGSGDRIYDWIVLAFILVAAILGTAIWCILDRKRTNYVKFHAWFRVFARFSLAATMLVYGASKVLPLQMPFPDLYRMIEPFGNFSPMGVLWTFIGASPAYEICVGFAETLGGLLLFSSRTTAIGALVCLVDGIQVFLLNMSYDTPVKLLAFHLMVFSLFLLAPDARRLANFFLLNRAAPPPDEAPLFRSARSNRIALAVRILVALYLVVGNVYGAVSEYSLYGPGAPRSPLYGIWNVQDFTLDGQSLPPLLTDARRWHRLIFNYPQFMGIYGMDDTVRGYRIAFDKTAASFELTGGGGKDWKADFSFSRPAPGQLVL
ncbi:MAG TPA: DoxX family protein, partial [Candidatus Methylomirabilis sp.]|nr:DoxX family protein [Candidatus Methylomirabilis sp.]